MVEPLPPADTAWLRMDSATNPMVVTALLTFDRPLSRARLEAVFRERLLPIERFREKPVRQGWLRRTKWQPDEGFDLLAHLHTVKLPAPGGERELAQLVSGLLGQQLDRDKALWHAYLVRRYRHGSALVIRLHHAIADGIVLLQVLDRLTDPLGPVRERRPFSPRRPRSIRERTRRAVRGTAALAGLLLLPFDPPSPLRGRVGAQKRAAWSVPFTAASVRAAARASGATLNDVLLAAAAGGLRHYLQRRGDPVRSDLRALVPVDLRAGDVRQLGNRFGLVFAPLPLSIGDRAQRLAAVKERMASLKRKGQAAAAFAVLEAIGVLSPWVHRLAVGLFERKASLVVTNVRGPAERRALAGTPIRSLQFWVPEAASISLGISAFTFAGEVTVGVATDAGLLPEPDVLVELIAEELIAFGALPSREWPGFPRAVA